MPNEHLKNAPYSGDGFLEAFNKASEETFARMREKRAKIPSGPSLVLFDHVMANLFKPELTVASARNAVGVSPAASAELVPILGRDLREYIERRRILTAEPLADGRFTLGRIALAIGRLSYKSFLDAFERQTGRRPIMVYADAGIAPRFDFATWNRAIRGRLSDGERRTLLAKIDKRPRAASDVDCVFLPERVRRSPQRDLWEASIQEALDKVREDLALPGLPSQVARYLRCMAEDLCDPDLNNEEILRRAGLGDTSIPTQIGFYFGDTGRVYLEKLRVRVAVAILGRSEWDVADAAEAVGVSYTKLLSAFRERLRETPKEIRRIPKEPVIAIDFESWAKIASGEIVQDQRQDIQRALSAGLPPVVRVEEPKPMDLIEKLLEELKLPLPTVKRLDPPASPWEVKEDWDELELAAEALSTNLPDRVRWQVERVYIESRLAGTLFRLREIQCAVTAAEALAGRHTGRGLLDGELWADWLKYRAEGDGFEEASFAAWLDVESRLVDPVLALKLWREADEKRLEILETGETMARFWGESCDDYLVARSFLDAAYNFHRGTSASVQETRHALRISGNLIAANKCKVVQDLYGLSGCHLANSLRANDAVHEARDVIDHIRQWSTSENLSSYVVAQIAGFRASIEFEGNGDPIDALSEINLAIQIFREFDDHLAARYGIMKSEILRHLKAPDYVATLETAIAELDRSRSAYTIESAETNLLYYLVVEKQYQRAKQLNSMLPKPTNSENGASRIVIEGCIYLAQRDYDRADYFFLTAIALFQELRRINDLRITLLYYGASLWSQGNKSEAFSCLETAEEVASVQGFSPWNEVRELIHSTAMVGAPIDLDDEIKKIAFKNGGCLSPE